MICFLCKITVLSQTYDIYKTATSCDTIYNFPMKIHIKKIDSLYYKVNSLVCKKVNNIYYKDDFVVELTADYFIFKIDDCYVKLYYRKLEI